MVKVLVKKLDAKVKLPEYKTIGSSGMDLMAFLDSPIKITPNSLELIPTGLSIAINFIGSLINSSSFFIMILFSSKYLSPAMSLILLHDSTDIMKRIRIVNFERKGWTIKEYKTKLHILDVKQK